MAGNPVKFRCYRCNQMLGISRSKIGAMISCPKCHASLVVPDPDDDAQSPPPIPSESEPSPLATGTPAASGLDLVLDIRPEDIRVEPGIVTTRLFAPEGEPPLHPEMQAADTVPAAVTMPATIVAPPVIPPPVVPLTPPTPAEETVLPPIETTAPRRGSRVTPPARPRDVVLPRSVVLAWSLFVLLSLTLAFTAGLLAGHYIWRVH